MGTGAENGRAPASSLARAKTGTWIKWIRTGKPEKSLDRTFVFFRIRIMARNASKEPTPAELEILNVLWESGAAPLSEVCARLRERRKVATTTVATMLGVMLRKGLVRRSRVRRGYRWAARVTRQATATDLLQRLAERVFDGSTRRLIAHLISSERLSRRERDEIRRLLDEAGGGSGGRSRRQGEGRS